MDSLHPRSTRASWWSPPVLQAVSSDIRATWPIKEKCRAGTIAKGVAVWLSVSHHHSTRGAIYNKLSSFFTVFGKNYFKTLLSAKPTKT